EVLIVAAAFSPDGLTLGTVDQNGRAQTWTAERGLAVEVFAERPAPARESEHLSLATIDFIDRQHLLASRPRARLAAGTLQPPWSLERTLGTGGADSPFSDRVNAVRFSPNGELLATGGGEPTRSSEIQLWRVADGSLQREFTNVHSDAVFALDFS